MMRVVWFVLFWLIVAYDLIFGTRERDVLL